SETLTPDFETRSLISTGYFPRTFFSGFRVLGLLRTLPLRSTSRSNRPYSPRPLKLPWMVCLEGRLLRVPSNFTRATTSSAEALPPARGRRAAQRIPTGENFFMGWILSVDGLAIFHGSG